MPLHHKKKRENIPLWSKRFSLFLLRQSFGLLKKKSRDLCVDISEPVLGYFMRTVGIYIYTWDISSRTALTTWGFSFGTISTKVPRRSIRILEYSRMLGSKRRFVDNTWKWVLGTFENHGYIYVPEPPWQLRLFGHHFQ